MSTFQMRCERDGSKWGEYVTAGETYTVTPPEKPRARGASYHFRNARTGGGTFMQPWAFKRATDAGWMVPA